MCESVGKAYLLSDDFDNMLSRESVDLPLTCHTSPILTTFTFRSSEVRRLLLELVPDGGTDPLGKFLLILIRREGALVSGLSVWCFGGFFDWVVS